MKRLYNRTGFTLAELLIVVAIIAVLVAVAIPTFSASSKRAKAGVCMANRRSALGQVVYTVMLHDGSPLELYDGMKWTAVLGQLTAIENICPDDGEITLLIRDSKYALSCSIHGGGEDGESGSNGDGSDTNGDGSDTSGDGSDTSGDGSEADGSEDVQEWVPSGRSYAKGDLCRYNGQLYECLNPHTTNRDPNWAPGITHSLWKIVN